MPRSFASPQPNIPGRGILAGYSVRFWGLVVAIGVATVFVHNRRLQEIFFPVVVMFNSIPVVAKAPILVLMMGNGVSPKIAIAALVCFFPTLVNSVRNNGPELWEPAKRQPEQATLL